MATSHDMEHATVFWSCQSPGKAQVTVKTNTTRLALLPWLGEAARKLNINMNRCKKTEKL